MTRKSSGSRSAVNTLGPALETPLSRFTLPNGLTVIHAEQPGGLTAVQLWVKTGSIHEAPLLGSGLSHYLEHMLFKGSSRRGAQEITAEVQAFGGDINAYTTFDRTVYHIEAPAEGFAKAMDILCDMAFHSLLDPVELSREKDVILREIDMSNDDPDRQLIRKLFETAFREHPYRQPVIGHKEQFSSLGPSAVEAYYRSRYTPQNMVLVVSGDVNPEALEHALEGSFAAQPRTQDNTPIIPREPMQLAPRCTRIEDDVHICRGAIAWRVPGMGHPDAPALDMLAQVLGGGESSVLCQSLRMRRKLVHEIDASCWNPGKEGLFWVSFTCDSGTYESVEAAIIEETEAALKRGFEADELERARLMAVTQELDGRKTVSGLASRLGMSEVVAGDLHYPLQYFTQLDKLSAAELSAVGLRHLLPSKLNRVTLDAEAADKPARKAPTRSTLPDMEQLTLSNGARLILQPDRRLPKVHIRYAALGGPLYEAPHMRGASSLLATLLTRDTQAHSAEEVSQIIEGAGGRFEDFCGNNSFGLAMELLSSDLGTGLELFEDGLLKPNFVQSSFDIERASQIARLRESEDEISERGRRLHRRAFFGEHPYASSASGEIEALEAMDVSAIQAHYARLIRARNSVLSVCGDFDPAQLRPRLEKMLLALPELPFTPSEPPFEGPQKQSIVENMEREQAVIFRSYSGPGVRSADYAAAEALDEALSDMSGQLFISIRERKGLTYFVGASRMVGVHTGSFTLYAGTRPDQVEQVREEFNRTLDGIRAVGLPEAELARARTRLKARRRLGMQTIGARANSVLLDTLYGLPIQTNADYDARIDALTPDSIRDFATRYLDENKRVDFVIGPMQEQLAKSHTQLAEQV